MFNFQPIHSIIGRSLVLFLFLLSTYVYPQQVEPIISKAKLSYLDGTPVKLSSSEAREFTFKRNGKTNNYNSGIEMVKDTATISFYFEGDYEIFFMQQKLAEFKITKADGKLSCNLPPELKFPFNYIVKGKTGSKVRVYDKNLQLIETISIDGEGYAGIKYSPEECKSKFFAYAPESNFIQPLHFSKAFPKNKADLSKRKFYGSDRTFQATRGMVHTINDDKYYQLKKVLFSDIKQAIWVLTTFDAKTKKAGIYKVDFPATDVKSEAKLFLDYQGNLILGYKKDRYRLTPTGKATIDEDAFVGEIYRFKNYYIKGNFWITPTFAGIALKEGGHNFTVNCTAKDGTGASSTESFNVIFDKEFDKLYRIDGSLNKDNSKYYRPTGVDPNSEVNKIDIKECKLQINGGAELIYSHIDESIMKGIHYADWDNEEQKRKAKENAYKNASRYIGFNMEGDPWGSSLSLFPNQRSTLRIGSLINAYEGPYPELRFTADSLIGEYATRKEAQKHCTKPTARSGKYRCYEPIIIKVCLDNYRYRQTDKGLRTDYDALYCGEVEPEENNDKGDEIVVVFSKEGYITETRALAKKTLEAATILLSGHVTDKQGVEIEGVDVKFRNIDGAAKTDDAGIYNLTAKAQGNKSHSEVMDIKLQKMGIEISNEELGLYKGEPFGLVSDGFTTLKLKVKAGGIRPQTVRVKPPPLGDFVEQGILKLPLVLDSNGEGELEYVPPAYLKSDQLTKHLQTNADPNDQYGLLSQIWVAEVPIEISYEDEEGNPGSTTLNIIVCRPPIFLMHGFTGDESTWATLGNYLRGFKYETYAREYYRGPADESTIQRQSEKLGFYIQKIREAYKKINILQSRIDIVAHSMGGLMSRYYINNMSKYGEKAGIVIPYDVKLSREQLAAARNQKPVKLIDVRKLIMVGTPNHGASKIDEIFGVVGALGSDYHQLANGQLRSDSEFFKTLNEGESEGRHLDPNVQYALLYGIRKRSEFYPPDRLFYPWQTSQKNFADDDGVVKVSSAILNGILNIPFPKDWFAMHGFIHSPAMEAFFMGDDAITESTTIFEEINLLLQEDIKRTPLKNSYAKIIRSDGDAYMKYFSTEDWKPIGPTPKKLRDHWCQIKTDEGSTSLGFFLDGHHWGSLHVQANTIVFYEYASPEFVKVYLQKGKARFRSRKKGGGGFEVVMGDEGEKWYEFNPKAKVRDVNTDFIVEEGEELSVQSIDGKVSIGIPNDNGETIIQKEINGSEGISLNLQGDISEKPLDESGWWSNIDTTYLPDEGNKKSGIRIEAVTDMVKIKKEAPIPKKKTEPIPHNLPIREDFSTGFEHWESQFAELECQDEKLYWDDLNQNPVILKTAIPMQNVVIEFDAWAEKNGITIEWFNAENKGYSISLGSYSNKKSLIGVRKGKHYDFSSFSGAHLNFKTWQRYKINLKKEALEVYVNDTLIGQKMIYQHFKGIGNLSLSSFQSRSGIDNVSIYEGHSSVVSADEIEHENILVNGSFEELPLTHSLQSIDKELAGWKVVKGSIDLTNEELQAADGKTALDLHGSPGFGSIQQSIETEVGKSYQISFKLSGRPNTLPEIKKLQISIAGETADFEFDVTGIDNKNMGWVDKTWMFVAKGTQTEIIISSLHQSGPAYGGACIDDVKVTKLAESMNY